MNPHTLESMNEFVAAHGGRAAGPVLHLRGTRQVRHVLDFLDGTSSTEIAFYRRSKSDASYGPFVLEFEYDLPFERRIFWFGFTSEKAAMACWDAIVPPEDGVEGLRLRTTPRPVPEEDEDALAGVIA